MTIVAVYDANVLYPSLLRDILVRVSVYGAVRARWTEQILDETFRNLRANRADLNVDAMNRTRALMNDAVRDARVTDFEYLIDELELPDPDDRHVLAAAIHTRASVIVTSNLKDFPTEDLAQYGLTAQHPDIFLTRLFDDDSVAIVDTVRRIMAANSRPRLTITDIVARLHATDLPLLAERVHSAF
ncbi:PIN domain-containing protein [Herbiconiux sp. KACC 21604]|uniref:PIN domain-containing protein n=1 Tax=unclassified Herbiconiux TaxID=2618217 RepID=UPI0014923515|nr:PIN domain-containing protein [Herbiconiux sp. SALV-R1]QJU52690.1 PIN domain-containing protein [Herbiconiux sp. SALV-R1]WPO87588.1 PIN domain-containing protein [Herbiconiux sp. KACC 21604]